MDTKDQLQALCGQLGVPVPPPPPPEPIAPKPMVQPAPEPEVYRPAEGIECWCPCDFRQLPVEAGSVKLIATDIPYDEKWLNNDVPDFAAWCADKLADEGVLVTFYGHHNLAKCLHRLSHHLLYRWQLVSPIYGVAGSHGNFVPRYQLAAVFSKSKKWHPRQAVSDIMPAGKRLAANHTADEHPHRKTVSQMQFIVEAFSDEGDLVVDSCSGSWTTCIACRDMNRRFIGGDKEGKWMASAKEKLKPSLATQVQQ